MTQRLRRAGAFAVVSLLSLSAPVLGAATAVLFAAIGLAAAFVVDRGRLFELFARPGDRQDGQLNGLAGFGFAAAGLALLLALPQAAMPVDIFVATLLILGFGNLGVAAVRSYRQNAFLGVAGFAAGGIPAAVGGQYLVARLDRVAVDWAAVIFLAVIGTLIAALLRELLYERDDPLVVWSVGLSSWFLNGLIGPVPWVELVAAIGVTVGLGWLSYALGTANVSGMLTGVLLGVLTIVLGGFGWFAVLIAFFSVGALASKYRYSEKQSRGVAEDNDGARGAGNVVANAGVALVAVVAAAAATRFNAGGLLRLALSFAFAGSLATALGDTLSSEIGSLFDDPRLITTFEPVEPGTDGAITWQGEVAGLAGVGGIAVLAAALMPLGSPLIGGVIVAVGGFAGVTADSLLGAAIEGNRLGNQSVNFLSTLIGGLTSVVLALVVI